MDPEAGTLVGVVGSSCEALTALIFRFNTFLFFFD
jgi:hypothetical protein